MRNTTISTFTNAIGRFVVDANEMLRFNLPRLLWHLRSSAGSLPGGSPQRDIHRGFFAIAADRIASDIKQTGTKLYSSMLCPALQPARATISGLRVRASERSLRLSHDELLTTTTPEHRRFS